MDNTKYKFIKLGAKWYCLDNLLETVKLNGINPETQKCFTDSEKNMIISKYRDLHNDEINSDSSNSSNRSIEDKLDDYIEIYDSQINELQQKQEELYSLIHTMQHSIDKLSHT